MSTFEWESWLFTEWVIDNRPIFLKICVLPTNLKSNLTFKRALSCLENGLLVMGRKQQLILVVHFFKAKLKQNQVRHTPLNLKNE